MTDTLLENNAEQPETVRAEDGLDFKLEMLNSLNEKLNEHVGVFDKFTDISGYACCYRNVKNRHFEAVGNFNAVLGMELKDDTDVLRIPELVTDDTLDMINRLINIGEDPSSDCLIKEFCIKKGSRWIEGRAVAVRDESGEVTEKYLCFRDVTTHRLQRDELEFLAYYDSLTGLLNRYSFIDKLNEIVERASHENVTVRVAMIDINGFKRINDSLGLVAGDELIQLFGQFLAGFNDEKISIARFGTDVFVMSIYDPEGKDTIENIVRTIKDRLKKPFVLSNKDQVYLTVTVGVADYPESGLTGLTVLQNAEISVYAAKDEDRDKIHFFDNALMKKFLESFDVEKKLQDAILLKSFELYYQPQYNIETGKLRGCEALIRWRDYDGTLISPLKFIPIAEKSGGIVAIGKWVIETAVGKLKEWMQKYNFEGIMSINISAVQLKKDNFIDELLTFISSANVDPSNIEIEITESVLIDNSKEVIEKVNRMRQFGLGVALDDFGTGFSSLSYLRMLPISTLKIDKSFIDTVITDDATGIITESVVNMVRRLGLETVAEGVEHNAQMDFLRRINCDNIQGYLLGKPMSEADFEREVLEAK
ncbi:MAG: EAL domain-containing protein [Lachnospiraceae bacterium]|nr:EAL domain-containing protein [Lachnospiraceae bacterium]